MEEINKLREMLNELSAKIEKNTLSATEIFYFIGESQEALDNLKAALINK